MMRRSRVAYPASGRAPAAAVSRRKARERVKRALALAWFLAALAATPMVHAGVPFEASQVVFLEDCQTAWGNTLSGWSGSNPDCSTADRMTCDSNGMIVAIWIWKSDFPGPIPNSVSNLRELQALYDVLFNPLNCLSARPGGVRSSEWWSGKNREAGRQD
ncbi:hypothetical protein CLOP_g16662 [Closterium sp. NIES-67]|nr:hypothetical protein CLOP_g16662 [Closterium sp. NIES-67]